MPSLLARVTTTLAVAPSETLWAATENWMTGASLSRIVSTAVFWPPRVAGLPAGRVRARLTASADSIAVLSMIGTANLMLVTPAPKVRVPDTALKSEPAVAVPRLAA